MTDIQWEAHTATTDFSETNPVQDMLAERGPDMIKATEAAEKQIGGAECPVKVQTWNLLLMPLQAPKETRSGIILSDTTVNAMEHNNYVAKIIKMGPMAFTVDRIRCEDREVDADNIPKVGDWVVVSRLSGQRINYKGVRMNVCTDDSVILVVENPTACYVMV